MSAGRLRWWLLATHVPATASQGGMVRYVVELSRALARRDDVELTLVAARAAAGGLADRVPGARVVPMPVDLPTAPRSLVERAGLLPGLSRADAPDVVHGAKHLLPRRVPAGATSLLTVHDMLPLDRPGDFPTAKRLLLAQPMLASARQADACVCVSDATRQRLLRYEPRVGDRAGVVGLAVAPQLLAAEPEPVPALAGRRFGLVVGDASPRKNLRFAFAAWARVRREQPDAVLAVVGPPGWGVDDLGDDPAAREGVLQLGYLSDGQLRWCYEQAGVVLCPSLLEGFGLPALEGVELGAPVLTSLDPALCEASGDRARHLATDDPAAWAEAALAALTAPRPGRPGTPRTWDDVAAETVALVRGARQRAAAAR